MTSFPLHGARSCGNAAAYYEVYTCRRTSKGLAWFPRHNDLVPSSGSNLPQELVGDGKTMSYTRCRVSNSSFAVTASRRQHHVVPHTEGRSLHTACLSACRSPGVFIDLGANLTRRKRISRRWSTGKQRTSAGYKLQGLSTARRS